VQLIVFVNSPANSDKKLTEFHEHASQGFDTRGISIARRGKFLRFLRRFSRSPGMRGSAVARTDSTSQPGKQVKLSVIRARHVLVLKIPIVFQRAEMLERSWGSCRERNNRESELHAWASARPATNA
jgi:hypothetical protein